eukprot:GILK01006495.1.p1 GENE.GILK01006495.1~~GILK01006495.1.p1  ORF type:complete len:549 (-),score=82.46 GILK01006495.1:254-1867(-)
MDTPVCDSFVAHFFKATKCVNCGHMQNEHAGNADQAAATDALSPSSNVNVFRKASQTSAPLLPHSPVGASGPKPSTGFLPVESPKKQIDLGLMYSTKTHAAPKSPTTPPASRHMQTQSTPYSVKLPSSPVATGNTVTTSTGLFGPRIGTTPSRSKSPVPATGVTATASVSTVSVPTVTTRTSVGDLSRFSGGGSTPAQTSKSVDKPTIHGPDSTAALGISGSLVSNSPFKSATTSHSTTSAATVATKPHNPSFSVKLAAAAIETEPSAPLPSAVAAAIKAPSSTSAASSSSATGTPQKAGSGAVSSSPFRNGSVNAGSASSSTHSTTKPFTMGAIPSFSGTSSLPSTTHGVIHNTPATHIKRSSEPINTSVSAVSPVSAPVTTVSAAAALHPSSIHHRNISTLSEDPDEEADKVGNLNSPGPVKPLSTSGPVQPSVRERSKSVIASGIADKLNSLKIPMGAFAGGNPQRKSVIGGVGPANPSTHHTSNASSVLDAKLADLDSEYKQDKIIHKSLDRPLVRARRRQMSSRPLPSNDLI